MPSTDSKNISKKALKWGVVIAVLPMLVATFVFISHKLIDGNETQERLSQNIEKEEPVPATRGDILAVDGRRLACSVPSYKVYMDPTAQGITDEVFNQNIDALAQELSKLFRDEPPSYYKNKITRARINDKKYVSINRKSIDYNELQRLRKFPIFNRGDANKSGLIIEENEERKMPFGILAARTIGKLYGDKNMGGMVGIENAYNTQLRGTDGLCTKVRIANRRARHIIEPPVNGSDIVTTIDIDIQDVAEQSLMNQLRRFDADRGVAILMEVKTGAIRAIANLNRQSDGTYAETYNTAIGELTEPGSTFKLATMMACLEDGHVATDDTINTFKGEYRFYDRTMRDSKAGGHGVITVGKAFEVSSNIAFSRLVQKYYGSDPQRFIDRLYDFGLGDSLEIDIKGMERPHIKNPGDPTWSGITLPWMSIGYEVRLTPLQVLTFYNAVANNGTMMKPMFVSKIIQNGAETVIRPKVLRNSIASRKTIAAVREMLKGVVENGTATNIKNTPYKIAGKTGTAQKAHGSSGYSRDGQRRYIASFAGFFPADQPLYSCIVVIYEPNSSMYYGNVVAGNVVKDIADRVYASEFRTGRINTKHEIAESQTLPYSKGGQWHDIRNTLKELDIPYHATSGDGWMSATATDTLIALRQRRFLANSVPDVRGMGASDAVSLLENAGLRVTISGYGRVTAQSLRAGSSFTPGNVILIQLSNE